MSVTISFDSACQTTQSLSKEQISGIVWSPLSAVVSFAPRRGKSWSRLSCELQRNRRKRHTKTKDKKMADYCGAMWRHHKLLNASSGWEHNRTQPSCFHLLADHKLHNRIAALRTGATHFAKLAETGRQHAQTHAHTHKLDSYGTRITASFHSASRWIDWLDDLNEIENW